LPKTPGGHTLDVMVKAPDGATVVRHGTWDGGPFPPAPPVPPAAKQLTAALTAAPAKPDALKARFDLAVGYGGAVAPPYAANGFTVTCVIDHHEPVPCFDDGPLHLVRVPGDHHLAVRVTAHGQTVLRHAPWTVGTPPAALSVRAPERAAAGDRIKIQASGLLPHEDFVIKIAGDRVAKGQATDQGKVVAKVRIPAHSHPGKVGVTVRGATGQRLGKDTVKVVVPTVRAVDPRLARILV
jgi:hypothetical protein